MAKKPPKKQPSSVSGLPSVEQEYRARAGWRTYRKILPETAPYSQVLETRRAFYAGLQHMLAIFWDMGDRELSDDVAAAQLERVAEEVRAFAAGIGTPSEGRAEG